MKKIALVLVTAFFLATGIVTVISSPSYAQSYDYPPPPADIYAQPWVGPDTPWVYYDGDWFLNGVLYYYFGPEYGWAPYYSYAPNYIVRPYSWYAPRWSSWYSANPLFYRSFLSRYPYWRGHREGQRYNRSFYEQHNHGQGGGWQRGFHGVAPGARHLPTMKVQPQHGQVQPQHGQMQPQHGQMQMQHGQMQHGQVQPQHGQMQHGQMQRPQMKAPQAGHGQPAQHGQKQEKKQ